MILYDAGDWLGVVFTIVGTVWPVIITKLVVVTLYVVLAYMFALAYSFNFGSVGKTILSSTMSFLLIFRANQAYTRYAIGRSTLTSFFTHVREFIMCSMGYIRGGVYTSTFLFHGGPGIPPKSKIPEDGFDRLAREVRIDIVRLCVAMCVALKMHTRIAYDGYCFGRISAESKWLTDWDRLRIRQLLTYDEFRVVDSCLGIMDGEGDEDPLERLVAQFRGHLRDAEPCPPSHWPDSFEVRTSPFPRPLVAVACLVQEAVLRNMNDSTNNQPWGIKERFVTQLVQLLEATKLRFEMVNQVVTTPLPLPYAHLCKLMLTTYLATMPFFVDFRLGWFANTVIPSAVSLALLGIDAIATELENPFGDDDNDLDVLEMISTLEFEAVELLRLTGDSQGCSSFIWRPMPAFVARSSCRRIRYQLAAKDIADVDELLGDEEWNQEMAVDALAKRELARDGTS